MPGRPRGSGRPGQAPGWSRPAPGWLVSPRGERIRRVLRRYAPHLVALAAAVSGGLALVPWPSIGPPPPHADYVMVVGVAGLRWDDIDRDRTPNLWRLADQGAIGALTVTSARPITCPADGWLTLGAGNRASRTDRSVEGQCPPLAVGIEHAREDGASLPDQRDVVRDNQTLAWSVQPGALAEAVRCTVAVGPGAAIAAARPYGRVDVYAPAVSDSLAQQLGKCALGIVDLGTVAGTGAARRAAAATADGLLARVLAARPARSLVIVAGLADTGETGRLHVVVAQGPGYSRGWLSSATTNRPGYVQLVDLAPTVLAALERPAPTDLFAGSAADRAGDRPSDLGVAVRRLADADREASVQRHVTGRFLTVLAVGQLLLFAGLVLVLRRIRRPAAGSVGHGPLPRWLPGAAEVLLIAGALAVPAALAADLMPWWRSPRPSIVFVAVTLGVLSVITAAVGFATRRRRTLVPMGTVAALAAIAVAADVMTGARLQLNGVAGYSAVAGGRYAGLGAVGLGVLVAGALLLAGALAQWVPRSWRPCLVAVMGVASVVVVGSGYLGADVAGAAALTAGVCVAAAMASGGWMTTTRLLGVALTVLATTVGFTLLDLSRPVEQRGNLARFFVDASDGTAGAAGRHIGEDNVVTIATSPLTVLVIGSALFLGLVLMRPWGGLRRLFGLYPAVRGGLAGVLTATLFAGLVEGVGFNVLGAALATAVPLVALGALSVLRHADDRTQPTRTVTDEAPSVAVR